MAQTLQEKAQLLQHLHQQKFPTLREKRLGQILDEYSFLRDRLGDDPSVHANSVLQQLSDHLKVELTKDLVPIPKKVTPDETAGLTKEKVQEALDKVKATDDATRRQRDLIELIAKLMRLEEAGLEIFSSINGEQQLLAMLDLEDPQPFILAIIAALTTYTGPRRQFLPVLTPQKLLDLLLSQNARTREYATHILANFTYEIRAVLPVEAVKRLTAIMIKYEEEQIGFQALRCLTNLAMEERHRQCIIDFQMALDSMKTLLKSKHVDYQAQVAWALSNLAASPFDATAFIEILFDLLSSPSEAVVYHSLRAISNFALFDQNFNTLKSQRLLDALTTLVESTDYGIQEEAFRCLSRFLAKGWPKESSFIESVGLACLTLIDYDYDFFHEPVSVQAAWCLAHLTNSYSESRQLLFDHNGLELLAMYLEEGTPAAQVPVLWALSGLSELVASRQKFRDLELLRPLVEFLFKNDNELQVPAERALANVMHDATNKKLVATLYQKLAMSEPVLMSRLAADLRAGPKK